MYFIMYQFTFIFHRRPSGGK